MTLRFSEVPGLLKETFSSWSDHKAPRLGAALSYYTILSLAPLLIVAVFIAGIAFGPQAAAGQIVWQIQDLVGTDGAKAIQTMIQSAHRPSTGAIASVLGVFAFLFGASGVFGELWASLN